MVTLSRGEVTFFGGKSLECMFCNKKASAYWNCDKGEIGVCFSCATSILPKLIADVTIERGSELRAVCDVAKMGAKSLSPDMFEALCSILEQLCLTRKLPVTNIEEEAFIEVKE